MHGSGNVKFANAQQAKQVCQYKNAKEKLYKTSTAVCYNKTYRQKQLTHNCVSIIIQLNSFINEKSVHIVGGSYICC
jgi:hypothetical protein